MQDYYRHGSEANISSKISLLEKAYNSSIICECLQLFDFVNETMRVDEINLCFLKLYVYVGIHHSLGNYLCMKKVMR